jgi:hypothetical protein
MGRLANKNILITGGNSGIEWTLLVPCSMQLDKDRNATSTPECQAGVRVVRRHNPLVRCSHRG